MGFGLCRFRLAAAVLRLAGAGVFAGGGCERHPNAGRNTPALVAQGLSCVNQQNVGAASLFLEAARAEGITGWQNLGLAVTNAVRQHPDWLVWGNDAGLERLFRSDSPAPEAFTEFIIRQKNRERTLEMMGVSPNPAVQELLRCRELTATTLFPPSSSASGQAFDAALSIGGLLLAEGRLTTGLSDDIFKLASTANRGGNSQPLEQVLMDLMSLGRRFNWDQLVAFTGRIEDAATLHALADQVRDAGSQLPVLFSVVVLSGKPRAVVKYLADFDQTGLDGPGRQSPVRRGRGDRTAGTRPAGLPHRLPPSPGFGFEPAVCRGWRWP